MVSLFLATFLPELATSAPSVGRELNSQTIPLPDGSSSPYLFSRGGGELVIIDDSVLVAESTPLASNLTREDNNGQVSLYVVRPDDSLSRIAEMFKVSANTIIWANDLDRDGDLIKPGQILVILPISGVQHTVVKGDTLASIAKKYEGDLEDIVKWNGLDPEATLALGSVVTIPDGMMAKPARTDNNSGKIVGSGPEYAGYYRRPIDGGVKTQGIHGYNGVDLAAAAGTPIYAAADGTVIVSKTGGWNGGYGNYVVIRHGNDTQTLYAHNQKNAVVVGERVVRGDIIGYVGSTGKSTGPHVHFEIRGAKNPF